MFLYTDFSPHSHKLSVCHTNSRQPGGVVVVKGLSSCLYPNFTVLLFFLLLIVGPKPKYVKMERNWNVGFISNLPMQGWGNLLKFTTGTKTDQ